jgi:hypothetical protein
VVQTDARPPVENRFIDVYELIERERQKAAPPAPIAEEKEQ